MSSMADTESPLLNHEPHGNEIPPGSIPCYKTKKFYFISIPCFLITLLAGMGTGYLIENGAFDKVTRDVRIVNGTVTEPNTHLVYKLNLPATLDGSRRPQRLIGLFLKVKHVPEIEANVHVFCLGIYVDRSEGRRELIKYKNGPPHSHRDPKGFEKFMQVISNGKVTFSGEYRMVMTTPGNYMHDRWLSGLVDVWKQYDIPPQRMESLKNCFSDWFLKRGFKNHDTVFMEFSSRTHFTQPKYNEEKLPACQDPLFGKAFVMHEFLENGEIVVDLLPTLWNSEYDDD